MKLTTAIVVSTTALMACGRSGPDARNRVPGGSSTVATSVGQDVPPETAASSTAKNVCPRTGQWARCSIEKRLIQSGFVLVPIKEPSVRRAGFSVLPTAYQLGKSRLEVFLYASPAAAARDVAGLDTLTGSPRGSRGMWGASPTFVRSANLIAILLTDSQAKADRLSLALTAGAPQP